MKLVKGMIYYFQINLIEDGCILQIVGHRNRLFKNNTG
jgi:hypothetical protein